MRKAFDLRPLAFGDVMGRGFSLYAAAFFGFARWFLLAWTLPMLVIAGGLFFLLDPYFWQARAAVEPASIFEPNSRAAYYWLLKLASIALGLTTGAAGVYYLASRIYVGGQPTLVEVLRACSSRSGHLTGASLLHLFAIAGITLAILGIPIAMIFGDNEIGGWALLVLLSFGWVPLLGWYLGAFGLNVPCVMLDDAQAGESFGRSRFLTHGYRMRLFGVIVTALLLVGAPGIPGLLTIPAWLGQDLLIDNGYPFVGDLIRILWEGALMPLFFIPQVVFYFDMRARKEGYDLAVMARNFGIEEGEMMRYRMNPHEGYRPPGYKPPKGRRAPPPMPQPQWQQPQPAWQQQQWAAPQPGWMPPPMQVPPMPAPRLPQRRPPRGRV